MPLAVLAAVRGIIAPAGLNEDSMQMLYHDWTAYSEYATASTINTAAPAVEVVPASASAASGENSTISINFAHVYNFSGVSDTQQFESLLTSHDDDMRDYILGVVKDAQDDGFRTAYA